MQANADAADDSIPIPEKMIDRADGAARAGEVKFSAFWNLDTVILKVESTLFNVPRQVLDVPGTTFADMFTVPPGDDKTIEGQSESNPIVLDSNISEHDFDAFLRMLLSPIKNPVSGYDELLGVLRLAHKWNYDEIGEKAIQAITPLISGYNHAATKVCLGKQFLVQEWLRQGLIDIAEHLPLELTTLTKAPFCLDKDYVTKIFFIQKESLREDHSRPRGICHYCPSKVLDRVDDKVVYCHMCGWKQTKRPASSKAALVEKVFKEELAVHTFHTSR